MLVAGKEECETVCARAHVHVLCMYMCACVYTCAYLCEREILTMGAREGLPE